MVVIDMIKEETMQQKHLVVKTLFYALVNPNKPQFVQGVQVSLPRLSALVTINTRNKT